MRPRFPQYFVLQCKRMLRQLPATLLVTVLLVGSAALLGSALLTGLLAVRMRREKIEK